MGEITKKADHTRVGKVPKRLRGLALEKVIGTKKQQNMVAKELGVSPQAVCNWVKRYIVGPGKKGTIITKKSKI